MRKSSIFILLAVSIFLIGIVVAVSWTGTGTNYYGTEDNIYIHNLSANITEPVSDMVFSITFEGGNKIYWNGAEISYSTISPWVSILNSTSGNFSINATIDSQTGLFRIPFKVAYNGGASGSIESFNFTINATNDVPVLTAFQLEYNLSQGIPFSSSVTATDEESHYPLRFNFDFLDNCTHAEWSGRNEGENCSVLNLTTVSSTSSSFSFTPTTDDVGNYWAYLNVSDAGENYSCPHIYCDNATYKQNKTGTNYLLKFNILANLDIDASNCTGQELMEGENFECHIDITTQGSSNDLSMESAGRFSSGSTDVFNSSWFFGDSTATSSSFKKVVDVNVTPGKRDVGNWSVNFSVTDNTEGQSSYEEIYLYVNYIESNVSLDSISDMTIYENATFRVNATDDDLLIRDSNVKDEILSFNSNVSWVSFSNVVVNHDLNYVYPLVSINYEGLEVMNHSVKINVTDSIGNYDEKVFVVQVLNDIAPVWNRSYYWINYSEGNRVSFDLTKFVYDEEDDNLTFFAVSDTRFDGFNMTLTGVLNYTTTDIDVGQHIVNITASDGKLSATSVWNFTVSNINDAPDINKIEAVNNSPSGIILGATSVNESDIIQFYLSVQDNDFLIPNSSFYNESIDVNVSFRNLTSVDSIPTLLFSRDSSIGNISIYMASYSFDGQYAGKFNVTINVTDKGNASDFSYFNLTVNPKNDMPNLTLIENQSVTINETFYLDVNATDEEDGNESSGNLTFSISNLTVDGDFLTINSTTGEINFTMNENDAGVWEYIVSVNDTNEGTDYQVFKLSVYGYPNVTFPFDNYIFNWTENSTSELNFSLSYSVNNINLSYEIYMDKIVYSNSTDYNYTELLTNESLRANTTFLWDGENVSASIVSNFTDETYGKLKNLTLIIFNPDYPELNKSVNWKVNINHTNQNITFKAGSRISDKGPINAGSSTSIDMNDYFEDSDYSDNFYNQQISFSLETISGSGYIAAASSFNDWNLTLTSLVAATEVVQIVVNELNSSGNSTGEASSNEFQVQFVTPTPIPTPTPSPATSGGSSTVTSVKLFSIRIIVPHDIIISDQNYIEVPFSLVNSGQVDVSGISLSNMILYNNEFSDNIKMEMEPTYLDKLAIGESKDFVLKISADTQKSGRYKATIFANVTSPKFSDWGDFFIDLKKINDTMAEDIVIFTEKLIAENPECLELTELFNQAKTLLEDGDYSASMAIAQQVADACKKIIKSNEQVKNRFGDIMGNVFYYLLVSVLAVFLFGFIFYVYRRIKFNKYRFVDEIRGHQR